jgi:hypothetical protein
VIRMTLRFGSFIEPPRTLRDCLPAERARHNFDASLDSDHLTHQRRPSWTDGA